MKELSPGELSAFIVRAKAATYIGGGATSPPCRPGARELRYAEGSFAYHDSYFGTADFLGQEVVYFRGEPVWAMNYYGRILAPDLITAAEVGAVLRRSLSKMYRQGRFLGGFACADGDDTYRDASEGELGAFSGREEIVRRGARVYELLYHGGFIKK
ncbi:MAG: DUF5680 domain-containing protein [Patescibacteria group bacterium]